MVLASLGWGNIALILLGLVLLVSGPYIIYRTIQTVVRSYREWFEGKLFDRVRRVVGALLSHGLNLIIGILFFLAGILFIWNNLRGGALV